MEAAATKVVRRVPATAYAVRVEFLGTRKPLNTTPTTREDAEKLAAMWRQSPGVKEAVVEELREQRR